MSDEPKPIFETSTETLLQAMVLAATMMLPDLPTTDIEPVWAFQENADHELTEAEIKERTPEDLPFFFLTRNGKPVLAISQTERGLTCQPIHVVWTGDPDLNPEKIYAEMESL